MKTNLTIGFLLIFVTAASYSHAQTAYRGVTPGTSTRAQTERLLGKAVKNVSATLAEYSAGAQADKIYVQYRAETDIVERIEILYAEGVAKAEIIGKLRLPRESASKVNARGNIEEYYSTRNIVLTFEGDDRAGGVRRVGYYSVELFASVVSPEGSKPAEDKKRTGASVNGLPEPPSEWMRAVKIGDSNTTVMQPDHNANEDRPSSNNNVPASLRAYTGVYEFKGASTPSTLATATVEVNDDRLFWKSRYITGAIRAVGGGSVLDPDGVTMSKFNTYVFVENEDIRIQFTIDNGRVSRVAFFDMSPGKNVNTVGFRRGE